MNAARVADYLGRLARAAPAAFLHDPVFRTAAIGAALALLFLIGRLGGHPGAVPPPPPPAAPLGTAYGQSGGVAAAPPAGPIAPSRSLDGLRVTPEPRAAADRFGTLGAARPSRKDPDARP